MGENNYTFIQSSYEQKPLSLEKVPYHLWKIKTKGFSILQRAFIAMLISIFVFGYASLIYMFITEGL